MWRKRVALPKNLGLQVVVVSPKEYSFHLWYRSAFPLTRSQTCCRAGHSIRLGEVYRDRLCTANNDVAKKSSVKKTTFISYSITTASTALTNVATFVSWGPGLHPLPCRGSHSVEPGTVTEQRPGFLPGLLHRHREKRYLFRLRRIRSYPAPTRSLTTTGRPQSIASFTTRPNGS